MSEVAWNFMHNVTGMPEAFAGAMVGGGLVALGLTMLLLISLSLAILYVYTSFSLMTIGKKLNYARSWFAWIPFLNIAMVLQLGGLHWGWTFLVLIPILGWAVLYALIVFSSWKICERRGYPGWLSLALVLMLLTHFEFIGFVLFLVVLGFVAWGKGWNNRKVSRARPVKTKKKAVRKKAVRKR